MEEDKTRFNRDLPSPAPVRSPMNFCNLTLVTTFYDLGRIEGNKERRQADEYFKHGDFVLGLDHAIIFFTEECYQYKIWNRRRELNLLNKTYIIVNKFDALPYYQYREEAYKAWANCKPVFPHKLSVCYSLLMWCKFYFVEEAIRLNPFFSTHFGWIDFGLYHFIQESYPRVILSDGTVTDKCSSFTVAKYPSVEKREGEEEKSYPSFSLSVVPDKIKIMQINYFCEKHFENKAFHYRNILDHIAGTLFTGSKSNLIKYCDLIRREILDILLPKGNNQDGNESSVVGFCPTDEPIIPIIITRYPDLFDRYFGDFKHLLLNYDGMKGGQGKVLNLLTTARSYNDNPFAYKVGNFVWEAYQKGNIDLTAEEKQKWLDDFYISAFYSFNMSLTSTFYFPPFLTDICSYPYGDKTVAVAIAKEYKRNLDDKEGKDPEKEFYKQYQIYKHRIDKNFSYLPIKIPLEES